MGILNCKTVWDWKWEKGKGERIIITHYTLDVTINTCHE
jgi:hypothetical protein